MQGQLFTQDFLTRGVTETLPHQELAEAVFSAFHDACQGIFTGFDAASTINEAQTEKKAINKVLAALGWGMTSCRRSTCRVNAAFGKAMRAARLMNGHHPQPTVSDFVIPQVLALSYTAHDMAPFARDLGYVDAAGPGAAAVCVEY